MTVETTPATDPTVDATPISAAETDQRFAELCATPPLSWPAVVMFGFGVVMFVAATTAAIAGTLPTVVAMGVNGFALYLFFSIMHDALH